MTHAKTFVPSAHIFKLEDGMLTISDKDNRLTLCFKNSYVRLELGPEGITLVPLALTKKHWAILNTTRVRINNMISDFVNGVSTDINYEYNSFCIVLVVGQKQITVKNYLGSRADIVLERVPGVQVIVRDAVHITLTSMSRELSGLMTSRLTAVRRLSKFALKLDKRKFFDNYYVAAK
jgi:ribosomal protein L6P/L9E